MHSKIVAFAAMAALAEQASAYNHNRHSHQMAKRAMETVFETVWETVYVTEGQEPGPTEPATNPVDPIVTSTSVVVVPSTTEAATTQPPPPAAPPATTMVTSVAPEPVEPPVETKPEEAPVETQPAEPPVEENPVDPEPPVETQPEEPPVETQPAEPPVEEPPVENKPEEPSSPSTGLNGKRGMAYNVADLANSYHNTCKGCNWAYNWGSSSGDLDSSVSFVPMCWGEKAFGHWQQDAENALNNGAKALLSFNEPDHADQANMSPSDAARMHKEQMDQFAGRAKIGSPAVTNGGGEMGITWLKNFMQACDAQGGCAIDFCVVHWYSEAQYADTLLDHLEQAHEACGGKPVWLTEFAPLGDDNQINDFMTNMIPKLDALDYLEAYSYFWVDNALMRGNTITPFGQTYATI